MEDRLEIGPTALVAGQAPVLDEALNRCGSGVAHKTTKGYLCRRIKRV
jgi:hypothetical protein